jgi:hypothetical protein
MKTPGNVLQARMVARRKEAGICIVCGFLPAHNGLVRCVMCNIVHKADSRARYDRKKALTEQGKQEGDAPALG